jgi:hypothetical protein
MALPELLGHSVGEFFQKKDRAKKIAKRNGVRTFFVEKGVVHTVDPSVRGFRKPTKPSAK